MAFLYSHYLIYGIASIYILRGKSDLSLSLPDFYSSSSIPLTSLIPPDNTLNKIENLIYSYLYVFIMATMNASEEAHLKVMRQRREMEEGYGRVVSISEALDVLLGVSKYEGGEMR